MKTYIDATAQIDYCYFLLSQWSKTPEGTPLEKLVDIATGRAQADAKKLKKSTLELLRCIVRNKKRINADYSYDEAAIKTVKLIKDI